LPGRHMQGNRQEVLRALIDTVMARAGVSAGALGGTATPR